MPKEENVIVVRRDREKPIVNQHPWVFSGAIESIHGDPQPGAIVTVLTESARFLARGYWNAKSQIQVRLLTWQDEPINDAWWHRALARAFEARRSYWSGGDGDRAYRLAHAESDYLPGLIVDVYGEYVVLQALTLGIDVRKQMLAEHIAEIVGKETPIKGVSERSDVDVRRKEGLSTAMGALWGEAPPARVSIREGGVRLDVDTAHGHKTGMYLDQAPNRLWLTSAEAAAIPSDAPRMLNLFSYTGAFGAHWLASHPGAQVVNVDASREVLENAEAMFEANDPTWAARAEFVQGDVFDVVRDMAETGEKFDVVVCDPPKFAHNAGQVEKAARGYKDLNLNSLKLVAPGGYMLTFSCSGAITRDLFQKIVFGALADTGRQAQIVRQLGAGADHPVALTFPEGEYLKGMLLRVY